jgi:hypothetical protein
MLSDTLQCFFDTGSQFRQPGLDGIVEPQLAFLHQNQGRDGRIEAMRKIVSRFMGAAGSNKIGSRSVGF